MTDLRFDRYVRPEARRPPVAQADHSAACWWSSSGLLSSDGLDLTTLSIAANSDAPAITRRVSVNVILRPAAVAGLLPG